MIHRIFLPKESRPPLITWFEFGIVICVLSGMFFLNHLFEPDSSSATVSEIQSTSYTIPADAKYVSTSGSDSNSGSLNAPYLTVANAISQTSAGGTIVIRGGTYHESITLSKQLTIQPYPGETVWFDGAETVSSWTGSGPWYATWTYTSTVLTDSNFIDATNYPAAGYPDMTFYDGTQLTQVLTLGELSSGEFYVDTTNDRLYIADTPTGHTVESSNLSQALNITSAGSNSVIRGLGFKRYATNPTGCSSNCQTAGAVLIQATGVTFEKNTVYMNAENGLKLLAANITVSNNRFGYNGSSGASSSQTDNLTFSGNEVAYNNNEHFDITWDAAGAKLTNGASMVISSNNFHDNYASGLWCDINCYQTNIVKNIFKSNSRYGLHFEISGYSIIASNIATGNTTAGIIIGGGSNNNDVYHNTLYNNPINMRLQDDDRVCASDRIATTSGCTSTAVSRGLTWDTTENNVVNNIFSKSSASDACSNSATTLNCLLSVRDFTSGSLRKTAEVMIGSLDYNAYHRVSSDAPTNYLQWSGGYNGATQAEILTYYTNLTSFQSYTQGQGDNYESHGYIFDNQSDPFFVNVSSEDFRIKSNSTVNSAGVALPSNIATALSLTAGTRYSIGAIEWYGVETTTPTPTPSPSYSPLASAQIPGYSIWSHRKRITINPSKVAATLTDFPVLISLTDYDLQQEALSSGADILFTDSDGTTVLKYEIEKFTKSTGTLVAWVKIPTLSSTSDTSIYMYYANATAVSQADANNVWPSSAKAVIHMAQDPSGTSPQLTDSTSNINSATTSGSIDSSALTSNGQIDGAILFDGTDDAASAGSASSIDDIFATGGSISAWVKATGYGENSNGRILDKSSSTTGGNGWTLALNNSSGLCGARLQSVAFLHGFSGSSAQWCTNSSTAYLSSWYHVVVTYDKSSTSNAPLIYLNGTSMTVNTVTSASGTANTDASQNFVIGNRQANADRSFSGTLDEIRAYSSVLSAAWIATEYNNQSDPSSFYSLSEVLDGNPGPTPTPLPSPDPSNKSTCHAQLPGGTPDLYQLVRKGGTATLYLSPVLNNVTAYKVIYGNKIGDERFGATFPITGSQTGSQKITINNLNPYGYYAFEVAAVNNCAVGSWSNWLGSQGKGPQKTITTHKYKKKK